MSQFVLGDIFDTNSNSEEDMDNSPLNDISLSFNYENTDLMSSEFFDNVNFMEHENAQDGLFNFDSNFSFLSDSSSHTDEVKSTKSSSSDSGKSSTCFDQDIFQNNLNNILLNDDNVLMSDSKPPVPEEDLESFPVIKNSQIKIIGQNPGTKKVIVTNPYSTVGNIKGNPKTKQILRVQPVSGNGKPLLLPFNVANFKTIKIVNPQDLQEKNLKISNTKEIAAEKKRIISSPKIESGSSDVEKNNPNRNCQYPPLILSDEEKRLLMKEGIKLPTHYPLTKSEEKELKRIRRKIRNKISAQDSRKRKKEYVDGLEERVKRGSEENKFLLKRVKQLQKQNSRLMAQLSKLQALIFDTSSTKATPATCLMIVLFSALLVSLPNMRITQEKELGDQQQIAARRALLFSHSATAEDDTLNMEEFLLFNKEDGVEAEEDKFFKSEEVEKVDFAKILDELNKNFEKAENNCSESEENGSLFFEACKKFEREIKDTVNNIKNALGDFTNETEDKEMKNKHGFYEPDIDEDWPLLETAKDQKANCIEGEYNYPAKRIKKDHVISNSDFIEKQQSIRMMSAIVGSQHKINASEI